MKVHDLTPPTGSRKRAKRVARGIGGRGGKTAGRGMKGQKARSKVRVGFEGGQMPLFRRLPKRGFSNAQFRVSYSIVNIKALDARFDDGAGIVVLNELALLVANSRDSLQTWNRTGTQGVKIGRCPLFRFVDVI